MTDKPGLQRLLDVCRELLPFLHATDDLPPDIVTLEYRRPLTRVEELRKEANELETKDIVIHEFRSALSAFDSL